MAGRADLLRAGNGALRVLKRINGTLGASRPIDDRRGISGYWREFRRWPVLPAVVILLLAALAIFAPLVSPYDPKVGVLTERHIPPAWVGDGTWKHVLGTDALGRDIFSRVVHGARISLLVAGIVLSAGAVGGTLLGLISGWYGGQIDEMAMRFVDFTYAMPFLLIAFVVVMVVGQSLAVVIGLLVVFSWNGFARQVRAEALKIKREAYVEWARIAGASTRRILWRHFVPGVFNTVMVMISLRVGALILTESILSFLGVGVPPPTPAWGLMVSDGRNYVGTAWWVTVFPGTAIFLTVFSFNFMGDWLRDHFDPRLRQLG